MRSRRSLLLVAPMLLSCGSDTRQQEVSAHFAISIAPLGSSGIGEALWDIEVEDGDGNIVFQRRLSSSRFGDGRGAIDFVDNCNPNAPAHTVRAWAAGLFPAPVDNPGVFGFGAEAPGSMAYADPTTPAPLVQLATCAPLAKTPVRFEVALMRAADHAFLENAVLFDDIYCGASFDCCEDADGDGLCAADGAEDHRILFDSSGQRGSTMSLNFACAVGPGRGATELFLDALWLDCTTADGNFAVDIAVAPGGPVGVQCEAGDDGMSRCDIISEYGGADADDALFQVAIERGVEAIVVDGRQADKVFWNVILGVKRPTIASCALRTRGAATRTGGLGSVTEGVLESGAPYPVFTWDVDIATCTAESLIWGDDGSVQVSYVDDGATFGFGYSSEDGVRSFCTSPCMCAGKPLADGTPCDDGLACTRGDLCVDGVCVGDEACSEAPGECWQPDGACGPGGACAFVPRASGEACTDDGNPCTVDQCDGAGACVHVPGHVGVVCRPAVDVCDAEERCDGTADCPDDQKQPVGTECRPAEDACDVPERCDGGDACPAPGVSFCGRCGAADGASFIEAPAETLCADGQPSELTGEGPWAWSCAGEGGADASCGAARSCAAATLSFGACAVAVPESEHGVEDLFTQDTPGYVGSVTARCDQGEWWTSEEWCEAIVDGACGEADSASIAAAPTGGLCRAGTASTVSGQGPWTWTCAGINGGAEATCRSFRACPAGTQTWGTCRADAASTARGGTVSLSNIAPGYEGEATATCSANGDGIWSLSDTRCEATVNGVCGAANNSSLATAPATNLCANGTPSAVMGSGPWSWTCVGQHGGSTISCTANRTCAAQTLSWGDCSAALGAQPHGYSGAVTNGAAGHVGDATATCTQGAWSVSADTCAPIIAGTCGVAHQANSAAAPNTTLCATGTASAVSGVGPWTWSCTGENGGATSFCTSFKTCAAGSQSWGSCRAETTTATRGATQSLANAVPDYQGAATATCSAAGDGIWSLSGTTCEATVHGACGAAQGGSTTTAPASNLCSAGVASAVTGSGPYTWTCAGAAGGTTASCSANRGCTTQTLSWESCGASQSAQPHGYSGTLSNTIGGQSGSATAICTQGAWSTSNTSCAQVVVGQCGSAHQSDRASIPTTNLCAAGSASAVSGNGPWSWTCAGANGGANATCTAYKTCAATSLNWNGCRASTTAASRGASQSLTNAAAGYQGSATATCSANGDGNWSLADSVCNASVAGQCGAANGGSTTGAPSSDLCAVGAASSVTGTGPYTWTCAGQHGGQAATCSSNRSCGAATLTWSTCSASQSSRSHGYSGSIGNTASGRVGSATATCDQGNWSVSDATCALVVTGSCGNAHNTNVSAAPSSNLCDAGTASGVSGTGPWTWTCNGANGGAPASCVAYRQCPAGAQAWGSCRGSATAANRGQTQTLNNTAAGYQGSATATCSSAGDGAWSLSSQVCNTVVNGTCGAANGGNTTSAPSSGLCGAGTASAVSGSGPYTWTCAGAHGGSSASCSSNRSCGAQTVPWGSCSASRSAQNHGFVGTLNNSVAGYTGSATTTCSQGVWSTSNTSCAQIIHGACGAAHNGDTASAPSANLCASGTASGISGSGPWTWSCNGANGGGSASCTSYKSCPATSLGWSPCGGLVQAGTRGVTRSLTNTNGGYVGSATATCSSSGNGQWVLSNTTCGLAGCEPGAEEYCSSCHCGAIVRRCQADRTWGPCNIEQGCVNPNYHCP